MWRESGSIWGKRAASQNEWQQSATARYLHFKEHRICYIRKFQRTFVCTQVEEEVRHRRLRRGFCCGHLLQQPGPERPLRRVNGMHPPVLAKLFRSLVVVASQRREFFLLSLQPFLPYLPIVAIGDVVTS